MTRTRSTAKPRAPASSDIEMDDTSPSPSANSQPANSRKSSRGKKATLANKNKNPPPKKGGDSASKKCNAAEDASAEEEEEALPKTVKKKRRTGTKSKDASDDDLDEEPAGVASKNKPDDASLGAKDKDSEIVALKKRLAQSEARQSSTSAKLKQKEKVEFEKRVQENNRREKAREAASVDMPSDKEPDAIILDQGEDELAQQLSGPAPGKDVFVASHVAQTLDKQHEISSQVVENVDIDRPGQGDEDEDAEEDAGEEKSNTSGDDDSGEEDETSDNLKNGSRNGSIYFGKENGMSHATASKAGKQKGQKGSPAPGKPKKSQFPNELQLISSRLRAHFKASLALDYTSSLDFVTWTWNLIKTFVKNDSEGFPKSNARALQYLRRNDFMKSSFIDYVLQVKSAFFHELVCAARPLVPTCFGLGPTVPPGEVMAKVEILQTLSGFLAKNPYLKTHFSVQVIEEVPEPRATNMEGADAGEQIVPPPKQKKQQAAELKAPFTNVVLFNVIKEAWFKTTGKQKIQPAILSVVQKSRKIPVSMIILAAVAVDHAIGEYKEVGSKKELTFTEEYVKKRYQYHHTNWLPLEKEAPAYTKKIQQELYKKIQTSSNGKLPTFAESESNDMNGIPFEDLQALAEGSMESLFDD